MRTWPALEVGPLHHPDLFQAALLDYAVSAIDETTRPDGWRVFFSTETDRNMAVRALSREFPHTDIRPVDVPDEDWVARSQAGLRAIQVGDIVVAPPWDVPEANVAHHVIVIRPSMGFGTGHHATTRMCLAAVQQIELRGRRVVDVGTGSGLLAIAVSRLGAARVLAIDDDDDALQAAQENISLNPGAVVSLLSGDVRRVAVERFDVVVANLTGALLREAAPSLQDLAEPGAHVILSGFMHSEESDVLDAYPRFTTTARAEEDEWLCVTLRRG